MKDRHTPRHQHRLPRDGVGQVVGLAVLLIAAGLALAGPTGLLAWRESTRQLAERNADLDKLAGERDELKNRVDLLDPDSADPDLVGELLRDKLSVAHPDEIVLTRP